VHYSVLTDDMLAGECNHLKPVVDSLPTDLSDEQRQLAVALILRNADVCSCS
jgi:hypothetical protein